MLAAPLCTIFNVCFWSGVLPRDWLDANIVPIFKKKGSAKESKNYRPISLTSVVCKIMEAYIKSSMLKHLYDNNLISRYQHGFLAGKSTLTKLLDCLNDWENSMDAGNSTDVVYFDLDKAFDSVVHSKLLTKCQSFTGQLLTFIRCFLSKRRQRVVIGQHYSEWKTVDSGVPQGSVLGPLLFLLYINDVSDNIRHSQIKLYADGTKVYRVVDKKTELCAELQQDINAFHRWCSEWQLSVSADKSFVIRIGKRQPFLDQYIMDSTVLPVVTYIKDLGVTFVDSLSFSLHCSNIVNKASQMMGLILRAFPTRHVDFMTIAFITKIRPLLEYNTEVWSWSPYHLADIDNIESIQRSFTKRIIGMWDKSYSVRLSLCKLIA